jgi:hypothetical protein
MIQYAKHYSLKGSFYAFFIKVYYFIQAVAFVTLFA